MDEFRRARETDCGDLALEVLRGSRHNMGLDGQWTIGELLAHIPQIHHVLGVHRQFVDGDVIWRLSRVGPSHYRVPRGVKNLLGVWAGEV